MTFLGNFNRRRDQERMKNMRSPVVKARSPYQKRRPSAITSPIDRHRTENREGKFEPVLVSPETVKAMQVVIQDLHVTSSPRSVTAIANALAGNRKVLEMHGNPPSRNPLHSVTKMLQKFSFRTGKFKKSDEDVQRRYQIMFAFNRLEKLPSSTIQKISSWEEAKEALRMVIQFPEDEAEKEESKDAKDDIAQKFLKTLDHVFNEEETENLKPYSEMWRKVASIPIPSKLGEAEHIVDSHKTALEVADSMFRLRLESATAELEERQRSDALKEVEERLRTKELEEEAKKRASLLMRPLSNDERERVVGVMNGRKPPHSILAQCDADSVQQQSMWTLQPGQWVNDEVIHYFLRMLSKRDEELCSKSPGRKRCHFFKSFFVTKLLNEGHASLDGQYDYRNVKRWSKQVPGKDIFQLDKVFFPINQGQMHWLCACAFITEKRIEVYDSMGSSGQKYLNCIFQYLQDDYKDKKGTPMPDVDDWDLVPCRDGTPQQRNGK